MLWLGTQVELGCNLSLGGTVINALWVCCCACVWILVSKVWVSVRKENKSASDSSLASCVTKLQSFLCLS